MGLEKGRIGCRETRIGIGIFSLLFLLLLVSVGFASRGIRVSARTPGGKTKKITLYQDYYALVMGCSDYRHAWPDLPNAAKDAKEVAGMLKKLGWKVRLLTDPTGAKMKSALNRLVARVGKKKNRGILIWYSGHGYTLTEADERKLGYIVPIDAPDPDKDLGNFINTAISMRQMETYAKLIHSIYIFFRKC